MFLLLQSLKKLEKELLNSKKGQERGTWFVYTLLAIIIPFTSSKTSNLLRCLKTVFGFTVINKRRYYTYMASPKIPWSRLWECLWKMIPDPLTHGKLLLVLDDFINPKTGRKIFGCHKFFDHAAKQNQSKYPWSQNVVAIGLLKIIKGRWVWLPLDYCFYHLQKDLEKKIMMIGKRTVQFQTKLQQATSMIVNIASVFKNAPIIIITDSWFGNNGLWKPVRNQLGSRFNLISRLRSNINLYDVPVVPKNKKPGRPKIYGKPLGNVSVVALNCISFATEYSVNLYGRLRTVMAYEKVVMLKTLKCPVRVVWIYRKKQWVALFTTDMSLSVQNIIEYYGARWKIEAGFKELKQDIGSAESQNRNPFAVTNHLNFCMMAISLTWIYADQLPKTPNRRHSVKGRAHFAFSDVRRLLAKDVLNKNLSRTFPIPAKAGIKSLIGVLLRMAA